MQLKTSHLKRATASTVVVAVVLCQGFVTGTPLTQVVSKLQNYVTRASTTKALRLPSAAQLSATGAVTLNGNAAPTGATVFSGGGVKTTANSSAVLSFGAMGQVELASGSDFTLAVEGATLGGNLRAGSATIVAPAGIAVKIVTADGPILTDGKDAVVLTVEVANGKTRVETSGSIASIKTPANVQLSVQDQQDQTPLSPEEQIAKTAAIQRQANRLVENAQQMLNQSRREKNILKTTCITSKFNEINLLARDLDQRAKALRDAQNTQDALKGNNEFRLISVLADRLNSLDQGMSQCIGESGIDTKETQIQVDVPKTDPEVDSPVEELLVGMGGFVAGAVLVEKVANDSNNTLSTTQPGQ